jgi:hypothetical protein
MIAKPALVLAALALLVAGCGSDEQPGGSGATARQAETPAAGSAAEREKEAEQAVGASDASCAEAGDLAGEPKRKPPADLALPGDAHVYESEGPFGTTERFFAAIDGEPADLPTRRDDASDALVESGYKLLSKDEEAGAEAEAHLSGKHKVDIQVIDLCKGKLRIRYTVS